MSTFGELQSSLLADMSLWAPDVLRQAAMRLQSSDVRNAIATDREHTASALIVLQARTQAFAQGWIQAMQALSDELDAPAARPSDGLVLSMLAEDQIDEDIEVARIVQGIESEAEWELRDLAALCSSLLGRDEISIDANPLHPGLVARALRRGLDAFDIPKGARLLVLRQVGPLLGRRLKVVYAQHCGSLVKQGVSPASYRVRLGSGGAKAPPAAAASPSASTAPGAPASSALPSGGGAGGQAATGGGAPVQAGTLSRLVQWAMSSTPPAEPQKADADASPALRFLTELRPAGAAAPAPALSGESAVLVMERLLAVLERQASISDGMRDLMRRLDGPARQLAATDPGLWTSLDHPWWQLLDRLISAGSVQDEIATQAPGSMNASLAQVVGQLESAAQPDAKLLRGALAGVDAAVTGLMEERSLQVGPAAASLQAGAEREDSEILFREQVVQQLRLSPAPAPLRQFLLGPWVLAMAGVTARQGQGSHELAGLAALVDALIETCARPPAQAIAPFRLEDLLRRARAGLAHADLGAARTERELGDLRQVLLHPTQADIPSPEEYTEELPVAEVIGGHAALPTVPIDMVDSPHPTRASLNRRAWIEGLEPGDFCRMFLQARWRTAQLTWRSQNRSMFVFTSRHGGRAHSMTRRSLEKLRSAGLVTTIEHGELIAQAMDTLIQDDSAR